MPTTPAHVRYTRTTTDNSDSVRYDNGATSLNWDTKELNNDDANARVEVGRRTDNESVRLAVTGSERGGLDGVEVHGERRINENSRIGIDATTDGDATHTVTGSYNAHVNANSRVSTNVNLSSTGEGVALSGDVHLTRSKDEANTEDVFVRVDESGNPSGVYRGTHGGSEWSTRESVRVRADGNHEVTFDADIGERSGHFPAYEVRSHLNSDGADAATVTRRHDAGHETVTVNHSDDGLDASYTGSHRGDGWRTSEGLSVDANGRIHGEVSGNRRGVIAPGTDGEIGGRVNTEGGWGVNGRVSHADAAASGLIDVTGKVESTGETNVGVRRRRADGAEAFTVSRSAEGAMTARLSGETNRGRAEGSAVFNHGENRGVRFEGALTSADDARALGVSGTYGTGGQDVGRVNARFEGELSENTPLGFKGSAATDGSWNADGHLSHALSSGGRVKVKVDGDNHRGANIHGAHSHEHGTEELGVRMNRDEVVASYNGRHRGSNWSVSENASFSTRDGARAGLAGTVHGEISDGVKGELSSNLNTDGTVKLEARRTHALGTEKAEVNRRPDGTLSLNADASRRLGERVEVNESASLNSHGEWTARHRADFRDGNLTGGMGVAHGHTGFSSAELTGGLHTEAGDHRGRIDLSGALADPKLDVSYGYRTNGGSAVNANGGIGRSGRYAGLEGRAVISDSTSGSANLRWGETTGVDAGARLSYRPAENTDFSLGVTGNSLTGRLGFDAKVTHGFTNDWGNGDVGAGVTLNKDEVGANAGGNLSIPNLFGDDASFKVGANGALNFKRAKEMNLGSDSLSRLRRETLASAPEGSRFVRYGVSGTASGNVGTRIDFGAGYLETGHNTGRRFDVDFIRLDNGNAVGANPSMSDVSVPGTASALLNMSPGEAVRISGNTNHATHVGGGAQGNVGPAGGIVNMSGGAEATYVVSGKTTTEITRGGDTLARVVVSADDQKTRGHGVKINVGLKLNLANAEKLGIPGHNPTTPIADAASGIANGLLDQWLKGSYQTGEENGNGQKRLIDVTIDLNDFEVQDAYNLAMKGDWSRLEDLALRNHPGVQMDRSIFSTLREHALPMTANFLGHTNSENTREVLRTSDVMFAGKAYRVDSRVDEHEAKHTGWFTDDTFMVSDFNRKILNRGNAALGDMKPEENWLAWSYAHRDDYTSKEEVSRWLTLANFVGDESARADIAAYRALIDEIKPQRKWYFGFRQELRETTVTTAISIDNDGLDNLANYSDDEYWDTLADCWRQLNPGQRVPDWVDPIRRQLMKASDPNVRMQRFSMLDEPDIQYEWYLEIRAMVEDFVDAGSLPKASRNQAFHQALSEYGAKASLIAALTRLAGAEHTHMQLSVDSSAEGGLKYNFDTQSKGREFDIQREVFGERI